MKVSATHFVRPVVVECSADGRYKRVSEKDMCKFLDDKMNVVNDKKVLLQGRQRVASNMQKMHTVINLFSFLSILRALWLCLLMMLLS